MRSSIVCSLLFIAACGGSDAEPLDEQPHCRALAKAWCDRYYACYTADQIAAQGLPRTVGDCVRELELAMACDALTPATTCDDGSAIDRDDAAACVSDVAHAVCSQLLDADEVARSCDAACLPVPGACPAVACNPADEAACGPGRACRLDDECTALCDDDVGIGVALDPCLGDADCAAGYTCADHSKLCTELCDPGHACGPDRVCAGRVHAGAGVQECSDGCIPGRDECPAAMTCALPVKSPATTFCVDAGGGLQGATCIADTDCAVNLMCLTDANGIGRCLRGCDAQNRCPDMLTCYGWTPAAIIRGVTFGSCQ